MKSATFEFTPDKPIGFGRKNQWIAAKCDASKDLADALQLQEVQPANWRSGHRAAYGYPKALVFITPPLNGWILAVGGLPDPSDPSALATWRTLMTRVSLQFGEAQFFATHRVCSYTAWGRYIKGDEKRLFANGDVPLYNFGKAFADEAELLTHFFDPASPEASNESYWSREDLHFPDEDDVFKLAQAWSIDPSELESKDLPPSCGLVGSLIKQGSV
jgi:hypothetical protein